MGVIAFCKFHGFGNDYIVIEKSAIPFGIDVSRIAENICHRHTGAGADGIAVIEPSFETESDFLCEIVNPDGSVAGFSGNGTRCAVSYIYNKKLWNQPELRLKTRSGINTFRLIESAAGHYIFESAIGKPQFASFKVPIALPDPANSVIDLPVNVLGRSSLISCVNVGNPVAITFVEDFDPNWRAYGKELESHPLFPQKANIVFVKVLDMENIEIRIWERGAGETSSSGTCSSGAAVLAAFTGRTGRNVSVHAVGGTTEFLWRDDDEMLITGRADLAFCGEWPV